MTPAPAEPTTLTLTAEEFDELEAAMLSPRAPTEAIIRGAALLRQLYPARLRASPRVSAEGPWYLGSMNDGAFILDGPPSLCGTDVPPHVSPRHPNVIAALGDKWAAAKAIVELHNAAILALSAPPATTAEAIRRQAFEECALVCEAQSKKDDAEAEHFFTENDGPAGRLLKIAKTTSEMNAKAIRALPTAPPARGRG